MSELPTQAIRAFQDIVGSKNVLTDAGDTWAYGYDNSRKHHLPDAVVLPEKTTDIQDIVKICYEHAIPLTCRGRSTGTTGGSIPIFGGIVLSLERLDTIIEFDPSNRIMIVEPGVLNETIQKKAATKHYFWAPDPSSQAFCTVGGNLACNAAGPRSIKYGTVRENTLGLKAILGDGQEISTGVHTTKGVVGYDFTRLFIGSEGTLGVITEAVLKLMPLPEAKQTICAMYQSIDGAVKAIVDVMSQPVIPCALEMMDDKSIEMIRKHAHADIPEKAKALLILEVDGSQASLNMDVKGVIETLKNAELLTCQIAQTASDAKQLWALRKALSPALRSLSPHKINEDVVVPISKMPDFFRVISKISEKYDIPIVNFGHGGNGNIHVNLLADPFDPEKGPLAHQALNELFETVIAFGGTLSGEHGVGIEKRDFVTKEIDPVTLSMMRKMKTLFDPKGLLNPGKLFPTD